jgi:hypothetical protein
MSIGYLLSEIYAGRCYRIKVPGDYFPDGVAVIVEKGYDGTYMFGVLVADIYINSHDPGLELLEELPEETHLFHCGECRQYKLSYTDEENDPSVCADCMDKHVKLNTFAIADSVYRFKTNQELKLIIEEIDGCSHHYGEDEDALHQSEQGLVVTDTHLGDFDDFPITWYRILPRSLLEF